jgi:omega-6 fatty acid desaturase (delta-12 desaturase)
MQATVSGKPADSALRGAVARFQTPDLWISLWQAGSSLVPFAAICAAMYVSAGLSYGLTLGLAVVAAGFVVRIFVIQHDCGHGSFFKSRRANDTLGLICSVITLTPYANWRRQHAGHHANWNNLDRRLSGTDIYSTCLTVAEYHELSRWNRLLYRVTRHLLISLLVLPPLVFLLLYRVPFDTPRTWRHERYAVYATDLAISAVIVGLGLLLGFERVLIIQLPIIVMASIAGVWIFSVQHRFEDALWQRQAQWNFEMAALQGSSYLRLPGLLQWFTANIGFHHVHHLNPRVPNYRLAACHAAIPILRGKSATTLWAVLRAVSLALWDENQHRMVTFKIARSIADRSRERGPSAEPATKRTAHE